MVSRASTAAPGAGEFLEGASRARRSILSHALETTGGPVRLSDPVVLAADRIAVTVAATPRTAIAALIASLESAHVRSLQYPRRSMARRPASAGSRSPPSVAGRQCTGEAGVHPRGRACRREPRGFRELRRDDVSGLRHRQPNAGLAARDSATRRAAFWRVADRPRTRP